MVLVCLYQPEANFLGCNGIIPEIEYDDIDNSLDQVQDFIFPYCLKVARHTALAIKDGLRGDELFPALMRDSRAWMFMRPDM